MPETVDRTAEIAKIVIAEMEHVDEATQERARRRAQRSWGQAAPQAEEEVRRIERRVQAERAGLLREPFVAFVRAAQDGRERILLFCRNYTPECAATSSGIEYVSYLAPVGAVAARPLGSSVTVHTPGGQRSLRLLERDVFRPRRSPEWDATENQIELARGDHRFVPSLRALLPSAEVEVTIEPIVVDDEAELAARDLDRSDVEVVAIPAEEETVPGLRPRRASIAEVVQLRDQPVLDEVQDPAFRLPLDTQLVITGAPGTGKTTLLVKRLSQKTKVEFLTPEERSGLSTDQLEEMLEHHRAWVLFTPTELLRDYLKEALGREGLPATSNTVRLWDDERLILGRDILRLLQVGRQGYFRFASAADAPFEAGDAEEILNRFSAYFNERHGRRRELDLKRLEGRQKVVAAVDRGVRSEGARSVLPEGPAIHGQVQRLLGEVADVLRKSGDPVVAAVAFSPLRGDLKQLRASIEDYESQLLDALLARDPQLLGTLGTVRETARQRLSQILGGLDLLDSGEGDGEGPQEEQVPHEVDLARTSVLADDSYAGLTRALQAWKEGLQAASTATPSIDALFRSVPGLYNAFRKRELGLADDGTDEHDDDGHEDQKADEAIPQDKPKPPLSIPETDLLVFFCLRMADGILSRTPGGYTPDRTSKVLAGIQDRFRTIVAVDEATDFSWVQLGCMYFLSHPAWRSFALCGDLMQRVTTYGLRGWEECEIFAPAMRVLPLRVAYRQSRTLLQIARRMYEELMLEEPPFDSPYIEEEEPLPLLLRSGDLREATRWVADRIVEIYEINDSLPTIAVFVPDDSEVNDVAMHLRHWLDGHAIPVEACNDGRILGEGQRVRVFAVEHIKGLEFHGVFLVGFDRMHEREPDVAQRYLYVGLSRAIMFLGLTVAQSFPVELEFIEGEFAAGDWSGFIPRGSAGSE